MLARDVVRARAWTATLDRWCAARPDLVAYRGTCLVHRAQMSTLGGDWPGALGRRRAPRNCSGDGRRPGGLPARRGAPAHGIRRRGGGRLPRGRTHWGCSPSRGSPGCARPGAPRGGRAHAPPAVRRAAPTRRARRATGRARRRRAGSRGRRRCARRRRRTAQRGSGAGVAAAGRARGPGPRRRAGGRGAVGRRARRPAPGAATLDRAGPPARLRAGARPGRPVPAGNGRRRRGGPRVRGRPGVLRAARGRPDLRSRCPGSFPRWFGRAG